MMGRMLRGISGRTEAERQAKIICSYVRFTRWSGHADPSRHHAS